MQKPLLIALDRDGTIIPDAEYLGKDPNWRSQLRIYADAIQGLKLLKNSLNNKDYKIVVITNQSGVARGYFSCKTIEEINQELDTKLKKESIEIDSWHYCPYVTLEYAEEKNLQKNNPWVRKTDLRKPGIGMLHQAAKSFGKSLEDFSVYVIGDKIEDVLTGLNANGSGILIKRRDNKYFNPEIWKKLRAKYNLRTYKSISMIDAILKVLKEQDLETIIVSRDSSSHL